MTIGQKITKLRGDRNLSQEELAERKRVQDSIALVQAQEMEAKLISEEIAQQTSCFNHSSLSFDHRQQKVTGSSRRQ